MNLKKQNQLFVFGLVLTGAFLFFAGGEVVAKDVNIGQSGDSVKILSDDFCLGGVCRTSWLWNLNGTSAYYNNGQVGIGTATPGAGFNINRTDGFKTLGSVTFGGPLYIGRGASSILTVDNSGNVYATSTAAITTAVGLPTSATNGQTLRYNNGSWLATSLIYNNGTNVGIGTTNPVSKLSISDATTPTLTIYNSADNNFEGGRIRFLETPATTFLGGFIHYDGVANVLNIGTHTVADQLLSNDINTISLPRGTGSVGIGTTAPSTKLTVNGGTAETIDVAGGHIFNLNDTPLGPSYAVPLGYLEDNFIATSTLSASSFWSGSLTGNISSANTGNVGIGTNNPQHKLEIKTGNNPSYQALYADAPSSVT
ncbi:hypothetical protein JXK06_00895, partial [Patescibacteria group bacterium]|nr:hypothetical protein [Patescibacteria group bacterium]